MSDLPLRHRIKNHFRVFGIALLFGMTAYGFIHALIWGIAQLKLAL